jgi:ketosteroid isomerase-like protein
VIARELAGSELAGLTGRVFDALAGRDFDAALEFFHPDSVWESEVLEIRFEGLPAIRDFLERWSAAYASFVIRAEDVRHVGNGIVLCVFTNESPLTGDEREPRLRFALVITWAGGLVRRVVGYEDIDRASASAERTAAPTR